MSRSKRKTKIIGIAGNSEKSDKRRANKKLRRKIREKLENGEYSDIVEDLNEVSNIWEFSKDGKIYFGDMDDEEYINELNRK